MGVSDIFGSNVFNLTVMKERLPKETFKSLEHTIKDGTALDPGVAEVVANAMKDWAIEKGATHYTHWFQPMTGTTAEKHDAFISPTEDGRVIMEFSGKELVVGEPDASSFPSGGLRATFEARGYTAWDPTSFAFVKDHSLFIPTTFFSYTGEVLDKKTPLLRSMEAINKQALRVLKFLNTDATRVICYAGAEQEYFLVDQKLYKQRKDLMLTGRTLFGAKPAKGQELDDHYFGTIKERVSSYMKEIDEELWKLGVLAKTKHNEVAPAQHELAPIFTTVNLACDQNQLMMDVMKKVAARHGLVCLLHEKPYEGVNGSGKHNNWSLGTNTGKNLLKPGKIPLQNKKFLLFLAAIIKAVDEYGDLLRVTVATAGNDQRLGANEAPPAIVSMFLGDQLTQVLEALKTGKSTIDDAVNVLELGVDSIPAINQDATDRNRTSPFAFTGNKFEFRMPGSSQSIAGINLVINAIVADALMDFADALEKADDPQKEISKLIVDTIKKHGRIIFNGNNYSEEWVEEAKRRGLPNLKTTVDAMPAFISEKAVKMFERHGVFTEAEAHSRYEILIEDYNKTIHIEALTTIEMAKREILPACINYGKTVAESLRTKKELGISAPNEEQLLRSMTSLTEELIAATDALDQTMKNEPDMEDELQKAHFYKDRVLVQMDAVRKAADELETMVGKSYWPFPT
ncbi:MAG TPA: glutamine synthetase III, partial [Candidatus Avimonoglobus intestinipullorum]|nr:glutamine synthetase III [Candidatus Avimonoglobus intestinipullorum]